MQTPPTEHNFIPDVASIDRLVNYQLPVSQILKQHPESIAISLLFSFANPKNELAIAEAVKPLGIPVSISHEILPEFQSLGGVVETFIFKDKLFIKGLLHLVSPT